MSRSRSAGPGRICKAMPDSTATAKLVFEFENEKFSKSPQIEIKAAGLDGRFAVVLGGDRQRIDHIDIRRLLVGGNDLAGSVGRRTGGGWRADIHAARLDGQNLLKGALGDTGPGSPVPLAINARIDRLTFGARRELQQVAAEMLRDGGTWQSARIGRRYANRRQL